MGKVVCGFPPVYFHLHIFLGNILVSEVLPDLNFTFDYLMQLGPKLGKWMTTEETHATRSTSLRKEREI